MNDVKLGTTPAEGAQRDAIHVAIAPCVAACDLIPGQHVSVDDDGITMRPHETKAVGIVDPFRSGRINAGDRCWLLLYQNTVIGMRHHWSHPSFVAEMAPADKKAVSIAWLERKADEIGMDYNTMMSYIKSGDYISVGEIESYKDWDCDEFARHVEIVTGKANAYPPFSCSC